MDGKTCPPSLLSESAKTRVDTPLGIFGILRFTDLHLIDEVVVSTAEIGFFAHSLCAT